MKKKSILSLSSISRVADNINKELKNMELDLKSRMTVGYWRVGRWIAWARNYLNQELLDARQARVWPPDTTSKH